MSPEDRKTIARLAYEAINRKDLTLLDNHPGYWETRNVFPVLFQAFPDLAAFIEQQTVDGDWVTTRATLRGTHLGGEFSGIAPTGKGFEAMHLALDQITEDGLVEHFGVTDWRMALR